MTTDPRLSDLLMQWEELHEQGRPVPVEDLCRDAPHLLDELRRQVQALQALNPLLRQPVEATAPQNTFVDEAAANGSVTQTGAGLPVRASRRAKAPPLPLPVLPGYDILRELGRGGMGVVYLARQTSLGRLVALKMLLSGPFTSAQHRQRFQAEAETVARLQHPNIVQLFEVGEVEGRAYCALEYVDGGTLAEALDGKPCPPRPAAALLATLADAVQAAHARGIIHRDLKPANVLLSGEWRPGDPAGSAAGPTGPLKITDFGLAKKVEADEGLTQTGMVMGTPAYMAPEQAAGRNREVGPATDVYALGCVLYECLTGRPPLLGASAVETLQRVLTSDPLPPRRLQPGVPRDLETICLKCLLKEPAKRYASARDLAEDLRRFLRGETTRARPTSAMERAVKWARRRPTAAALLAVSLLAVLTLLVVGLAYNAELRHERDKADNQRRRAEDNEALAVREKENAEANFARAEANHARAEANFRLARDVVNKLSQKLRDGEHVRMEDLRKDLRQLAQTFYLKLVEQRGDDPALRHASGWAYLSLAQITSELGQKEDKALDLCKQAVTTFEKLHQQFPDNLVYERDLALACYTLGQIYREISRLTEAEKTLQRALQIQRTLRDRKPDDPDNLRYLARTYRDCGLMSFNLSRGFGRTEGFYREGLKCLERLAQLQAPPPPDVRVQASLWEGLSGLYLNHRQYRKAYDACTRGLKLREQLANDNPTTVAYQADLARSYTTLGTLHTSQGQKQEARPYHEKAQKIREKLRHDHPTVMQFAVELGLSYHCLGLVSTKVEERLEWFGRALEVEEGVLATERNHLQARYQASLSYEARSRTLYSNSRYQEALADLERAEEYNRLDPPALRVSHAEILARLDRHQDASIMIDRVLRRKWTLAPLVAAALGQAGGVPQIWQVGWAAERSLEFLTPDRQVELARICVLCVRAVRADTRLTPEQRERLAAGHADRAVSLLAEAGAVRYFRTAEELEKLKKDPDFEVLRDRPAFQKLSLPPTNPKR